MVENFSFSRTPQLFFGKGCSSKLFDCVNTFGSRVLLISGKNSLSASGHLAKVIQNLTTGGLTLFTSKIMQEPSPDCIDHIVSLHKHNQIQVVCALGGGSVIDAGKAIAAMLCCEGSITAYLEDIGTICHPGTTLPFIAVPTTAGTGSEATKNAVITRLGSMGFKKSLRHDNFIPRIAIIDPVLTLSCPGSLTAACGMDALSQLIESYLSTNASPITDGLALNALTMMYPHLYPAYTNGHNDITARTAVSYGAYISGITLANAGLGIIHGIAGVIGGLVQIPHGVACGTLLAPAMRMTILALLENPEQNAPSLKKIIRIGKLLSPRHFTDPLAYCHICYEKLEELSESLAIPKLGTYNITTTMVHDIAQKASNKNNPIALSVSAIESIISERL